MLEGVLLPCTWPELEGLAQIATGSSRARVFIRDLGGAGPDRRLVLCLRGAPGAVRVEGPMAAVAEVLAARARAAALRAAAVHRDAGRAEAAQLWRARARGLLKEGQAARRGPRRNQPGRRDATGPAAAPAPVRRATSAVGSAPGRQRMVGVGVCRLRAQAGEHVQPATTTGAHP
ncbi:hypothetical protein EF912_35250 [Streptomyces sp. WAC07061]|uniref:hypothetical protein n=1 Tax=Streptomyces sp. WAC07061 TaxID=2487410 RepID=UPI000F78A7F4|nr:hypothetical protein [Streptomyces sp. WAC07061]RSS36816.1 hypothetical protein EF912_35250 [Streptomyces sp. WAC07061]